MWSSCCDCCLRIFLGFVVVVLVFYLLWLFVGFFDTQLKIQDIVVTHLNIVPESYFTNFYMLNFRHKREEINQILIKYFGLYSTPPTKWRPSIRDTARLVTVKNFLLIIFIASIFMIFDIEYLQPLSKDAGRNPTVPALSCCEGWAPQFYCVAKRDLCTASKSGRHHQSNNIPLVGCLQREKWILKDLQYFRNSQVRDIPVLRALFCKASLVKLS